MSSLTAVMVSESVDSQMSAILDIVPSGVNHEPSQSTVVLLSLCHSSTLPLSSLCSPLRHNVGGMAQWKKSFFVELLIRNAYCSWRSQWRRMIRIGKNKIKQLMWAENIPTKWKQSTGALKPSVKRCTLQAGAPLTHMQHVIVFIYSIKPFSFLVFVFHFLLQSSNCVFEPLRSSSKQSGLGKNGWWEAWQLDVRNRIEMSELVTIGFYSHFLIQERTITENHSASLCVLCFHCPTLSSSFWFWLSMVPIKTHQVLFWLQAVFWAACCVNC